MHSTNIKELKEAFDSWRLFTSLNEVDDPEDRMRMFGEFGGEAFENWLDNLDTVEPLVDPTGKIPFLVFGEPRTNQFWIVDDVDGRIRYPDEGDDLTNFVNISDLESWVKENVPEDIQNGPAMERWSSHISMAEDVGHDIIATAKELRNIQGIGRAEQVMPTFVRNFKKLINIYKPIGPALERTYKRFTLSGREWKYMQKLEKRAFKYLKGVEQVEKRTANELEAFGEPERAAREREKIGGKGPKVLDMTKSDRDGFVQEVEKELKLVADRIIAINDAQERIASKEALGGPVQRAIGSVRSGKKMQDIQPSQPEEYDDILRPPREDEGEAGKLYDALFGDASEELVSAAAEAGAEAMPRRLVGRGVRTWLTQKGLGGARQLPWPKTAKQLTDRLADERYFQKFLTNILKEVRSLPTQKRPSAAGWGRFFKGVIRGGLKLIGSPKYWGQNFGPAGMTAVVIAKLIAWGMIGASVYYTYDKLIKFFAALPTHIAESAAWSLAVAAELDPSLILVDAMVGYFGAIAVAAHQKEERGEDLSDTEKLFLTSLEKSEYVYQCDEEENCNFVLKPMTKKGLEISSEYDEEPGTWEVWGDLLEFKVSNNKNFKIILG